MKSSFIKYLLLTFVLVALMSISAFAFDIQGGTIDVNSAVNLRQMPNTSSKILDRLYDGERVAVLSKHTNFYKVSYEGTVGYIHIDYVDLQPIMNVEAGSVQITASSLNVRSGPSTSYKILTSIPKGETAEIIGINDGWFKIKYKGIKGYVSPLYVNVGKFLTVTSSNSGGSNSGNSSSGSSSSTAGSGVSSEMKLRQQIVDYAETFLGVPYVWGGTTPKGFDCSGLVKYVYNHFGISICRTSYEQYHTSVKKISKSQLEIGDLVFFTRADTGNDVGHVGIYVGDGMFIHAPRTGKNVEYASLSTTYYKNAYVGSGTMFK
ncbi:MAG: C40 family peptidase [Clostridia bacterium]|nr:C40 family peptidase [Clostridia bacterium]